MVTPNIAVIESQKRATQAEFLRWSKTLEDTSSEIEATPEDEPKRVYLALFSNECRLLVDHYRDLGDMQEKTLSALRDKPLS
jgi:hypothetical protein